MSKTLIRIPLLLVVSLSASSQAYDWVRSSVNEFWYNQIIGDCSKAYPLSIDSMVASLPQTCSKPSDSTHANRELGFEISSDLYFDEALNEQAIQNQCQFDYWSAMSTSDSPSYEAQDKANKTLGTQFKRLKDELKSHSFSERKSIFESKKEAGSAQTQAQKAQAKTVDSLVEVSYKIAKLQMEHKEYQDKNRSPDVNSPETQRDKVTAFNKALAVLENSYVLSEDPEVQDFVKYKIVPKITESIQQRKLAYPKFDKPDDVPDLSEFKKFFLSDRDNSFQSQVVLPKLEKTAEQQSNYAKIDGQYSNDYNFKVATVQSGVGSQIMNNLKFQQPLYGRIQCDLDSKYGKGEKVASVANSIVVGGVTIFFGGGALVLARLAQIGIASQRAARITQVISSITNSTLTSAEIAKSVFESCPILMGRYQKKSSAICGKVAHIKDEGLDAHLKAETDHSQCLTDLGLASLSGVAALKSAVQAKKLQRLERIAKLGIADKYEPLVQQINSNVRLSASQKKSLLKELNKSVSLSDVQNFPRSEFLKSLADDSPEDLYLALKQINESVGTSFVDKFKSWLPGRGLNKEDAKQLEQCMIDGASKTSLCNSLPNRPKS